MDFFQIGLKVLLLCRVIFTWAVVILFFWDSTTHTSRYSITKSKLIGTIR